jgi:hypothetical protein
VINWVTYLNKQAAPCSWLYLLLSLSLCILFVLLILNAGNKDIIVDVSVPKHPLQIISLFS